MYGYRYQWNIFKSYFLKEPHWIDHCQTKDLLNPNKVTSCTCYIQVNKVTGCIGFTKGNVFSTSWMSVRFNTTPKVATLDRDCHNILLLHRWAGIKSSGRTYLRISGEWWSQSVLRARSVVSVNNLSSRNSTTPLF